MAINIRCCILQIEKIFYFNVCIYIYINIYVYINPNVIYTHHQLSSCLIRQNAVFNIINVSHFTHSGNWHGGCFPFKTLGPKRVDSKDAMHYEPNKPPKNRANPCRPWQIAAWLPIDQSKKTVKKHPLGGGWTNRFEKYSLYKVDHFPR